MYSDNHPGISGIGEYKKVYIKHIWNRIIAKRKTDKMWEGI